MYEIIMAAGSENDGLDQEIKNVDTAAWSRNPLPSTHEVLVHRSKKRLSRESSQSSQYFLCGDG